VLLPHPLSRSPPSTSLVHESIRQLNIHFSLLSLSCSTVCSRCLGTCSSQHVPHIQSFHIYSLLHLYTFMPRGERLWLHAITLFQSVLVRVCQDERLTGTGVYQRFKSALQFAHYIFFESLYLSISDRVCHLFIIFSGIYI
jgi:hypothetical protein